MIRTRSYAFDGRAWVPVVVPRVALRTRRPDVDEVVTDDGQVWAVASFDPHRYPHAPDPADEPHLVYPAYWYKNGVRRRP